MAEFGEQLAKTIAQEEGKRLNKKEGTEYGSGLGGAKRKVLGGGGKI